MQFEKSGIIIVRCFQRKKIQPICQLSLLIFSLKCPLIFDLCAKFNILCVILLIYILRGAMLGSTLYQMSQSF